MIATITLNPSLDEHIAVNGLIVEEANRWSKLYRYAAGKGIDVSRAIHEMGGETMAYGFIGGPKGRTVEILLDEEGVPYSFTPIRQETRTNFIITDTKTYKQTRIDAPGPPISKKALERFYRKIELSLSKLDILVAAGSIPPGIPKDIYYDLVLKARTSKVRAFVDTGNEGLKEAIKAKPYLIKPNVHEAEGLLGIELDSEEAIIRAALRLVKTGIKIVVISRGKDGIIAATEEKVFKAVPPQLKVKSAVGAGDCTLAGLALKLAKNGSLMEACRLGVAMGAATVLTPGTELCHRDDVERLLPQIKVWEMTVKQWAKTPFTVSNKVLS
ncbi:MAG: 1-phosphofructokinase [Dehalococcoidia bacterium]|nr:MAG: 1-phosphofructokinase [Dehalococcoidia bacterium]